MDKLKKTLTELETRLQNPAVRGDTAQFALLLHESFIEFGRSGNRYDRGSVLESLSAESSTDKIVSQDFEMTCLSSDSVLLTYRSAVVAESGKVHRHALRASVWVQTDDGWKIRFHQGTPTAAFELE